MEKQFCNQCNNQCPVDSLKCNRGRKAFGIEMEEERQHQHSRKDKSEGIIGLLRQCGHQLHHGTIDVDEFLSRLTIDEQKELEGILKKLLA